MQSQRSSLNTWHRDLAQQHDQKETISRNHAVIEERIRSLKNQIQDLETEKVRLSEALSLADERLGSTSKEAEADRARLDEAARKAEEAKGTLEAKHKQMTDLELEASRARDDLDQFSEQQIRLRSRSADRVDQIQRMNSRLGTVKSQVEQVQENLKKIDAEYQKTKEAYEKSTAAREKLEQSILKIQEDQRSGEQYRQELQDQLSNLKTENSRLAAELNVLQQADQQLAGYADGAKLLLQGTQTGKIAGTLGTLNNFIDVPEEYEKPIAAALGGYLDAIILEGESDTEKALELLLSESTKGVLLPLNQLIALDRPSIPSHVSGFIGVAADLIKAAPKIRPVTDLLLGRVLVMKDKKDVKRVLRDQPLGTKAVTLMGEVFHATGEVVAGFEGQPSILSRSRQKKTWQEKIESSLQKISDLEKDINQVNQKLAEHRKKEEVLKGDLAATKQAHNKVDMRYKQTSLDNNLAGKQVEWETARYQSLVDDIAAGEEEITAINHELEEIQIGIASSQEVVQKTAGLLRGISVEEERAQLAHWETQAAVAERALHDIEERLKEREVAWKEAQTLVEKNTQSHQECQDQVKNLTSESQSLQNDEKDLQQTIVELRKLVDETEVKLSKDEEEQRELQRLEAKARQVLNQAERTYAQADINLARNKEKLENIQERIKEDIGLVELEYDKDISGPTPLPMEGYVQKLPVVKEISSDLGSTIREQRAQLRRLGAINPEAQTEYREVNERHNFLTEQLDDLKHAEADLREVITELDVIMEREFRKTFNAVAGEFKEIFTQLFGGGKGQLILSEPDDLTGSGVDIQVRLPGRRTQGLSLLSGGERSLIAAALIFALLKISPTPFCVLDEVDAMLDEANVARYRKLLRELSSDTQFIVITHNRNTVEVADIIYGIIMAEDSTSQVLSLKLDEVDEVIES